MSNFLKLVDKAIMESTSDYEQERAAQLAFFIKQKQRSKKNSLLDMFEQ